MLLGRGLTYGLIAFLCAAILSACATAAPPLPRIALLAPFEGEFRAVGYDALYAARLAVQDAGAAVDLVPIDDGGTHDFAVDRARALSGDPLTVAVLLIGCNASSSEVQQALGDVPAVIVGNFGTPSHPAREAVFVLAAQANPILLGTVDAPTCDTANGDIPVQLETGQTPLNAPIYASASIPDTAYVARIRASDPFAPEPMLLSSLIYDAASLTIPAAITGDRADAAQMLTNTNYQGLNGSIRFVEGWWADAPIYAYHYDATGRLTARSGE
ncbi:MAG: hypothetical protein U0670_19200 [Anaerolineae bacterium]